MSFKNNTSKLLLGLLFAVVGLFASSRSAEAATWCMGSANITVANAECRYYYGWYCYYSEENYRANCEWVGGSCRRWASTYYLPGYCSTGGSGCVFSGGHPTTISGCWTCDTTIWGSWGACSEPCDGGTQSRTNDCGTTQNRACNTQPCCTATDPSVPVLVSPSNDSHLDVDSVTLDWDPVSAWGVGCPSNTNEYRIYVEAGDTTPDVLVDTVGSATTSYDFTLTPNLQYYWQIVATNGSNTVSSAIWTFILDALVEGTVYYDPDNTCSTSNPSNFGGITASVRDTSDSDVVAGDGTFAIMTTYGGGYILDMEVPVGHTCSVGPLGTGCGGGCPSQTNVFAPSIGNNFFFTDNPVSWWQVTGASVYAGSDVGGQTIRSLIPLTISASSRYLILSPPGGSDAVAIRRSGSLILASGEVSSSGYSALSGYGGRIYDYDFWVAQIGLGLDPADDFLGDSINKPVNDPNKEFYYVSPDAIYIDFGSPWNVASGESYVVMVDGDLRINQNITVANGGFLAFIVSGDVDVDPSVTDIQGVFIIDGAFNTESQYTGAVVDVPLAVEGTVVAWANVSLNRDLGNAGNAVGAAETFTYRPDFIINMPGSMKAFILRWRELPAGVIGD